MHDSKGDTLEHIQTVQIFLDKIIIELMHRAQNHDETKLRSPEKEYFDEWTPKLSSVTYGSDEYCDMLDQMRPAIDHHHKNNPHHPEFFNNDFCKMNLIDLMEMLADWKAATKRHNDGNINESLEINARRFNIPESLICILKNTIKHMGWG